MEVPARECPGCKFIRIPDCKIVKQKGKSYKIFECRGCHLKDIEPHTPLKLWDGNHFVDEGEDSSASYFNPQD